jgi:hypothetical protein
MQGVYCLEEGDRNRHIHVQAAALLLLAPGDNLAKDLQAYLRLQCNFETGTQFRWAIKIVVHHAEASLQPGLRKVTFEGLVGYCLKQKNTSTVFRYAVITFAYSPVSFKLFSHCVQRKAYHSDKINSRVHIHVY